ncbi:cupin domain-containing protein [Chengkuizengella axinellae]|uniref:Cupin domain-containing protein n=1 Tax=Chengkuizengella axinellae TaxID=3064388 RepID=A0ABT9IU74_9BACL|nr:cupin domain-containing protein [Chengkuizengella sp. 2205SS18-9]MDP5272886.1 cupin domain-containing protein [Chengkuizengella sp. 2205SS18-9]
MESIFNLEELLEKSKSSNQQYNEFLKVPSMSVGIYELKAGDVDTQKPHTEDELYYIIEGESQMFVGEKHFSVKAGSFVFVEKNVEHRFYDIEKDLTIIVFFSPAEYTNA